MMEDKNQMAHQDPVDQEDLVETDVRPLEEREKEAVKGELIETEQPWIMKRKQNISAAGVLQGPASLS